jgi:excisionase family DNA binding protein
MLTLDQVKEVLNVNTPGVCALVRSGELRAVQFGGRNYLAHLLGLMRILPRIAGEERRMPREVSVRFVSIVERRCAGAAA